MKKILIADDHDVVRSGVRAVLEQRAGWEVVAEATDGRMALEAAFRERPDVAIVDFSMPRMTGVEVARRIARRSQGTEILLFTVHDSGALARAAFEAGARAYVVKSEAGKLLVAAVEALMSHKTFFGARISEDGRSCVPDGSHGNHPKLSPREVLVVKFVAEGYTNKAISAVLGLSVKTTEAHRASAMRKLGVNSTAALVRYAVRADLIEA